jgi:hypothetical protein
VVSTPGVTLGIVRTASAIYQRVFRSASAGDSVHHWKRRNEVVLEPVGPAYSQLRVSWKALAAVTEWNAITLGHVLAILRSSVADHESLRDAENLPAVGLAVLPPAPPRATAANPRAYRGTKFKPKKPTALVTDLRPYLLLRRHIAHVLELLDYDEPGDPYVVGNFRVDASANFDPWFVSYMLPVFSKLRWAEINALYVLARALDLEHDVELRNAVITIRYFVTTPSDTLAWLNFLYAHPAELRLGIAEILVAAWMCKHAPPSIDVAMAFAAAAPVALFKVYEALASGASTAYLLSGLQLDAIWTANRTSLPVGQVDVTDLISSTVERLANAMELDSGAAFWQRRLWEMTGSQPELIDCLGSESFARLSPTAAFESIRCFNCSEWLQFNDSCLRRFLRCCVEIVDFASKLELSYQCKFIAAFRIVDWECCTTAIEVAGTFRRGVTLNRRIAQPPFSTQPQAQRVLAELVFLNERVVTSLVDEQDYSWLALEQACVRKNRALMLSVGLNVMERRAADLMTQGFAQAPAALMQTAVRLYDFKLEQALEIIDQYLASSLACCDADKLPVAELCKLVAPVARAGGPNPVRRALRLHLEGKRQLTDEQLRRHRTRIVQSITLIRLAALRQLADRVLAHRIGRDAIADQSLRHGLGLMAQSGRNRRGLQKFLQAHEAGDVSWVQRHPTTQQWLRGHPLLNLEHWLNGISVEESIEGIGPITISIAQDPLDALKLGTYVSTCLGRGGGFEFSAAAVVLDINKQVAYARDATGAVVGRQLLAISKDSQLVCYAVYGSVKTKQLEPLFRRFDVELAAKLKLPIFQRDRASDDYANVEQILSQDWWDDGDWNPLS